jgi:hypothetical protein
LAESSDSSADSSNLDMDSSFFLFMPDFTEQVSPGKGAWKQD